MVFYQLSLGIKISIWVQYTAHESAARRGRRAFNKIYFQREEALGKAARSPIGDSWGENVLAWIYVGSWLRLGRVEMNRLKLFPAQMSLLLEMSAVLG